MKFGGKKYGGAKSFKDAGTVDSGVEKDKPREQHGATGSWRGKIGGSKYGGATSFKDAGKVDSFLSKASAEEGPKVSARGNVGNPGVGVSAGTSGKASVSAAKSTPKADKATPKAKAAPKPVYKAKGVPDYNKQLGDVYLNATSGMFSSKAGGKKK